ncbi:HAAS signaling domain-containing protein [Actinoplanes sp. CA-252034]|uniref:HAAS signaling domain-containing protein n=1 Tax=Actinoplanes sp. CA-252034 TaxID=3239906 RepID=UPI003D9653E2
MTQTDELVTAYLARVERAASRLPAGRREELLGDLREHIEIARAESGAESEAEVRTILERLGDPESIVAAADTQTDLPRITAPAPFPTAPPMPAAPPHRPASRTALWVVIGVVTALVVIFFCFAALTLARTDEGPAERPVPPAQQTAEAPPSVGP